MLIQETLLERFRVNYERANDDRYDAETRAEARIATASFSTQIARLTLQRKFHGDSHIALTTFIRDAENAENAYHGVQLTNQQIALEQMALNSDNFFEHLRQSTNAVTGDTVDAEASSYTTRLNNLGIFTSRATQIRIDAEAEAVRVIAELLRVTRREHLRARDSAPRQLCVSRRAEIHARSVQPVESNILDGAWRI